MRLASQAFIAKVSLTAFLLCLCVLTGWHSRVFAVEQKTLHETQEQRIVTLAPHLTELVFALGKQPYLVAVSEASNYPVEAQVLPTVANHRGVDLAAIIALKPTHILAWEGGNKPQDIMRLKQLGFNVLAISVSRLEDISSQINALGRFLDAPQAHSLQEKFDADLSAFRLRFANEPALRVFYYSWPKPLQSVGANAWVTTLLQECGLRHIFAELPTPYPQVSLAAVLHEKPPVVIAGTGEATENIDAFWQAHASIYQPHIIIAEPDKMHRFTTRILPALNDICQRARLLN